jgi:hypothetical protein
MPISQLRSTNRIEDQPELEPAPHNAPRRPVRRSSRAAGITTAAMALWPDGVPVWLAVKERDAAILAWLSERGIRHLPSTRHIRRILNSE